MMISSEKQKLGSATPLNKVHYFYYEVLTIYG